MPNLETLIVSVSPQIMDAAPQITTYVSTIDLNYAYSQLNLHSETANFCNFNIISGDMTCKFKYRFQT